MSVPSGLTSSERIQPLWASIERIGLGASARSVPPRELAVATAAEDLRAVLREADRLHPRVVAAGETRASAVGQVEALDVRVFRAAEHELPSRIEAARVQRPIVRPLRNDVRQFRIETCGSRHGMHSLRKKFRNGGRGRIGDRHLAAVDDERARRIDARRFQVRVEQRAVIDLAVDDRGAVGVRLAVRMARAECGSRPGTPTRPSTSGRGRSTG